MKAIIFTPGDIICKRGEVAREMFIIADGIIQVLDEDKTVLRTLGAGDFFGEIGLLGDDNGANRRTANVRSLGYSELFSLANADVLAATRDYPDAAELLEKHGIDRLSSRPSVCSNIEANGQITTNNSMPQIRVNYGGSQTSSHVTNLLGCSITPQGTLRRPSSSYQASFRRSQPTKVECPSPTTLTVPVTQSFFAKDNATNDDLKSKLLEMVPPSLHADFLQTLQTFLDQKANDARKQKLELTMRERDVEWLQTENENLSKDCKHYKEVNEALTRELQSLREAGEAGSATEADSIVVFE